MHGSAVRQAARRGCRAGCSPRWSEVSETSSCTEPSMTDERSMSQDHVSTTEIVELHDSPVPKMGRDRLVVGPPFGSVSRRSR